MILITILRLLVWVCVREDERRERKRERERERDIRIKLIKSEGGKWGNFCNEI